MRTEDGDVIRECLNGDSSSFGLLIDKYKAGIFALAYSKLCNFHDAEDVTQEVFLKAYKNLHTLKRWDSFFVWIRSMTINFCKDKIKSHSRRIDNEYIEEQSQNDLENISLDSYQEDQWLVSHKETLALLDKALESLPETYRQVLTLHYLGGMSGERISQFLGISYANVRQRLNRAREQLREEMTTVMDQTFQQQKLPASFTFRIVEMVKKIRINPISDVRNIPWGLSLATGLIFTILSFNSHFMPFDLFGSYKSASLLSETKVLKAGEIPVDILKISSLAFLSSEHGKGNNGKIKNSDQINSFLAPKAEGDQWTKRTDMPTGRQFISCSAVNGKVYAIGGNAFTMYSLVEEYDPIADTWTTKADMLTRRCGLSTCVANGKIYAIGGSSFGIIHSVIEEYDPIIDKWTKKADMPTPRWSFSTASVNGKVYAIGGATGFVNVGVGTYPGNPISAVEEYDPVIDKWTKKGDMPIAIAGSAAVAVNGKIYVMGGGDNPQKPAFSTLWAYDPVADEWTKKTDMPTPRGCLTAAVVNGRIFAIGGTKSAAEPIMYSTVEEYDPVTDTWTTKADMPTARATMGADTVNDKIYVVGGSTGGFTFLSTMEEYDPGVIIKSDPKSIDAKGKLPSTWGTLKTK